VFRVAWWLFAAWAVIRAVEFAWLACGLPVAGAIVEELRFYGVTYGVVAACARHHLGDPWTELVPLRRVALGMVAPVVLVTLGGWVVGYQLVTFSLALGVLPAGLLESGVAGRNAFAPLVTDLVATSLLPGVFEEALVRGIVLHALAATMSRRRAIAVSAFYFAVMHMQLERMADTFLFGLAYGWMFVRTGSLLPGMLAHALHNAACVVLTRIADMPGAPELDIPLDEYGMFPAWIGWTGAMSVAAGLLWIRRCGWLRKNRPDPSARDSEDSGARAA
jgi:membrane protease YdiL (CAAX protease family)